jgi:hypothetical protein
VYDLKPANGRATMSQMIADAGAIGGVNGDFFQWGDDPGGDPVGIMVRSGELVSHPGGTGSRAPSVGWGDDGPRILPKASWTAYAELGRRRIAIDGLNEYARENGVVLCTPTSGYAIRKGPGVFLVLRTRDATLRPAGRLQGVVLGRREDVEKLPVPPGTLVLAARGTAAEALRTATVGETVRIQVNVRGYDFRKVDQVMGGGPVLLTGGAPTKDAVEDGRNPRTAMGTDRDGNIWYAVIDGRQANSVGATLRETAEIMRRLGCVEAINLDGGGSSSIHLYGLTLNRPSGGQERAIANGILWHGPLPARKATDLRIEGPAEVGLGETARLSAIGAAGDDVVWSAQGAAWVDQDGVLHPLKAGEATVAILVGGVRTERKITVRP